MTPTRRAEITSERKTLSDKPNLLDLPSEILLRILQSLPIKSICCIKLACLRFCKLAHCREIMEKQSFVLKNSVEMKMVLNVFVQMDASSLNLIFQNDFENYENDELTSFLRSNGPKINSITFRSCHNIPQKMVEDIMLFCVHMKELSFDHVEICESQNSGRIQPEQTNAALKILVYKPYRRWRNAFTANFLISLLNFYAGIESFTWDKDADTDQQVVESVMECVKRKVTICSGSIQQFHLLGMDFMNEWEQILRLNLEWPKLLELTLDTWIPEMKELECLLRRCPQLESVSLVERYDPDIFYEMLRIISKYHGDLKTLVCDGVCFDYDEFWKYYYDGPTFPTLQKFEFKGIIPKEEPIRFPFQFLHSSKNLKYLNLNCPIAQPDILEKDMLLSVILPLQNNLITLEILLDFNYIEGDKLVARFENLNVKFPELEVLRIRYDGPVKNSVFASKIVGNYDFPRLKKLELGYMYCVEKEDIEKIIKGCPNLEFFEFYCDELRKNRIVELCNNVKNLKSVRIKVDKWNKLGKKRLTEFFELNWQYPVNDERFLKFAMVPCACEVLEYID